MTLPTDQKILSLEFEDGDKVEAGDREITYHENCFWLKDKDAVIAVINERFVIIVNYVEPE